jgi:hypothetical protein
MKIRSKILLLFFFGGFLCSCAKDDYEPSAQWVKFNCRNTQKSFNIDFLLRISATYKDETLPVMLEILSPSGIRYKDTLKIPVKQQDGDSLTTVVRSGVWRDILWHYRKNVRFPLTGRWLFTIYYLEPGTKEGKLKEFKLKIQ